MADIDTSDSCPVCGAVLPISLARMSQPHCCGNVGPRIGQQAPRCVLPPGHDGDHRAHESWHDHSIVEWSDLKPVAATAEPDHEVVRSEIRGQCEKRHVLIAEVFGPELVDEWRDSCPLPECGFDITWERRPAWMAGSTVTTGVPDLGPLVAYRRANLEATTSWAQRKTYELFIAEAIKLADAAIEMEG